MQKKRNILPIVFFVALVIVIALVFGISYRYKPTKEKYNLNVFFGNPGAEHVALMVDDILLEEQAIYKDESVYIPYEYVRDYICDRFFWDNELQSFIYVMPDGSHIIGAEEGYYVEDETIYMNLELIAKYAQISYTLSDSPNRLVINTDDSIMKFADVEKASKIRYRAGVKSPILKEALPDEKLRVLDTVDDWTHVVSEDGFIGYIKSNCLSDVYDSTYEMLNADQIYASNMKDEKICMAWHQVTSESKNSTLSDVLANVKGMNVISPTWFYLSSEQGDMVSFADAEYVNTCHSLGIDVWALLENITYDVNEYNFFNSYSARQNLIQNIINECLLKGIDGVNVDFEYLSSDEGYGYIQFIRELSIACHGNNLVLSVDNYVPYNFNSFYNRSEQAVFADYVIVMAYDEHLNEDTGAGSVSSLGYVTYAIEETMKEVPKEKLIAAIPFYTRLWSMVPKTEQEIAAEGEQGEYSSTTLNWKTLSMNETTEYVAQNGMTVVWDEATGQNYAESNINGTVAKIWIEDERSLEEKIKVVQANDIAGISAWKLGFETENIWTMIERYYPE